VSFKYLSIQAAGIPRKLAHTIGIAVDPRRQNLSEEGLKANVERLKEYQKRLILFPRRVGKHKKTDASAEDVKKAKAGEGISEKVALALPILNEAVLEEVKIKDVKGEDNAYRKLRLARSDARLIGVREKRAKAKADEAEAKKK
jgi:large subunit ribosomal protein L13e